jgi:hypothetical protein
MISFKSVWHGAVSRSSDHGSHSDALLHEVLLTDGVIEMLTNGNIVEFDVETGRAIGHAESE